MRNFYLRRKLFATLALLLCCITANAYDFTVDGIYYNITSDTGKTVGVTYQSTSSSSAYSGDIVIPSTVEYSGTVYSVTSIESKAFASDTNLTSITIPSSVTSIGNGAFSSCTGVKNIIFEDGTASLSLGYSYYTEGSVGSGLFASCTNLERVYLGRTITYDTSREAGYSPFYLCENILQVEVGKYCESIPDYCFRNSAQLRSLIIGEKVSSIATNAINRSNLKKTIFKGNTPPTNYTYAAGTYNYISNDSLYSRLNSKNYKTLIRSYLSSMFEVGGVIYNITDPKTRSCEVIDCIYGSDAENIVIDSVVTYYVTANRYMKMSVGNIQPYSVYKNPYVKSIDVNNDGWVGLRAFEGCVNSEKIYVTNSDSIGFAAFLGSGNQAETYIVNDGIVSDSAFKGSGISTLKIYNNGYIGRCAFYKSQVNSADVGNYGYIGYAAFRYANNLETCTLGENIPSIGNYAFANCSKLKEIIIPDGVTYLGDYSFSQCSSMTKAAIGKGLTMLNYGVFSHCTSMTDLTIGENVARIYNSCFEYCNSLPEIIIPKKTTDIRTDVFNGCTSLSRVFINDKDIENKILSIQSNFSDCPLDTVYVGAKLKFSSSPFLSNDSLRTIVFSELEDSIHNREFSYCTNLNRVFVGDSIKSIGAEAFMGCSSLKNFLSPAAIEKDNSATGVFIGNSVQDVGNSAFYYCSAIQNVIVGNNVPAINGRTFACCKGMKDIKLGINSEILGDSALYYCSSLKSISIPQANDTIGDNAFKYCSSLKILIIEDRTDTMSIGHCNGSPMFVSCPLDSVYIGGPITYNTNSVCGYSPFYYNKTLRTVVIGDLATCVLDNEFYNCTNLTDVFIGNGCEEIRKWAFSGCLSLKNFSFGNKVKSIGDEAFSDCTAMERLVSCCNEPPVCGEQALADIDLWLCGLYVPEEYLDAYYYAPQWENFFWIEGAEYTAKFIIENDVIEESMVKYNAEITTPEAPAKVGYTFTGWEELPTTMPAFNITIYGNYKANDYTITYIVDGEEYQTGTFAYNTDVTPIEAPQKDDYTFSHWESLPATMPAENIEVVAVYNKIPTELTISINKYGSSTYCSEYPLNFSEVEGLKAYAATGYNTTTGVITLTKVNTAAAGVGLFIMGEQGTYVVPVDENASDHSMNMLVGTMEKININSTSDDGEFANFRYTTKTGVPTPMFYRFADGSSFSAGKSYLQIPISWLPSEAMNTIGIRFEDGETTDIEETIGDNETETIYYDLNGHKVTNPESGIYIVNGKKVFINKK